MTWLSCAINVVLEKSTSNKKMVRPLHILVESFNYIPC